MSGSHEREGTVAELMQTGVDEGSELVAVHDFAVLPRGFESRRVREAAGGERGVGELPEKKV